jgi:hypothetical protein
MFKLGNIASFDIAKGRIGVDYPGITEAFQSK